MHGIDRARGPFRHRCDVSDSQVFGPQVWGQPRPRLLNVHDMRLRQMDKHGFEMMILSLNAPVAQVIHDVKRAIAVAREANDVLPTDQQQRHLAQRTWLVPSTKLSGASTGMARIARTVRVRRAVWSGMETLMRRAG